MVAYQEAVGTSQPSGLFGCPSTLWSYSCEPCRPFAKAGIYQKVWEHTCPLPSQTMEGQLSLGPHFTDEQGSEIWRGC